MMQLARLRPTAGGEVLMQQWMMIAGAIAGFALQTAASAAARDYPERPITLIVPQAPGGGNDVIARILAETMSRTLGQQIISGGGGGRVGVVVVAWWVGGGGWWVGGGGWWWW